MTNFYPSPPGFSDGVVILIDKPVDWTSFDVVRKIKYAVRQYIGQKKIKVGHAGTLDPLASGLLIICTGQKTKEIELYQNLEKEYTGTFYLGASTESGDLETIPDQIYQTGHITDSMIYETCKTFIGKSFQVPPLFSAKKINGKRAYEHARRGDNKTLSANSIEIFDFEITRIQMPEISFRVVCSKGTYIRSLAVDFGKALGSGAYLKELRRIRIGNYKVTDAYHPEAFARSFVLQAPEPQ